MDITQAFEILKQLPADQQKFVCEFIDFLAEWGRLGLDKCSTRELRRRVGVTQQKLAELTGTSVATVRRAERGRTNPEIERKLRLFVMLFRFEKDRLISRLLADVKV